MRESLRDCTARITERSRGHPNEDGFVVHELRENLIKVERTLRLSERHHMRRPLRFG